MTRRLLLAGLVLLVAFLLVLPSARAAGTWLVVEDPLQSARAVVVLGGQVPFRAMEAARIYKEGWAREVWLTQGSASEEDLAMSRLGIDRPAEYTYSREVLTRRGVPGSAIRVLPERMVNTAEELRAIGHELDKAGGGTVIVVTSKYHARRVAVLWQSLFGHKLQAVVRYSEDDPFDATRWWHNTDDAMHVSREWFGLVNAWFGFPVASAR